MSGLAHGSGAVAELAERLSLLVLDPGCPAACCRLPEAGPSASIIRLETTLDCIAVAAASEHVAAVVLDLLPWPAGTGIACDLLRRHPATCDIPLVFLGAHAPLEVPARHDERRGEDPTCGRCAALRVAIQQVAGAEATGNPGSPDARLGEIWRTHRQGLFDRLDALEGYAEVGQYGDFRDADGALAADHAHSIRGAAGAFGHAAAAALARVLEQELGARPPLHPLARARRLLALTSALRSELLSIG